MSARVLITTIGSLGDLHPYLAVGRALTARGASVTVATSTHYRATVENDGLDFAPLSPDLEREFTPLSEHMPRFMDPIHGSVRILREVCLPFLEAQYDETRAAARDVDLLVSHMLSFATPIVAEQLGLPWANTVLAPCSMFSVNDPSVPPGLPWARGLRVLGPRPLRGMLDILRMASSPLVEPIQRLRARHGLPRSGHPLVEGQVSPLLQLALFSERFAAPARDWPPQTRATGFPFRESSAGAALPEPLERFLDAGEPPVVFTLGSSAVHVAGDFYDVGARAAHRAGRRAVLLTGRDTGWRPAAPLPPEVHVADFASYAGLFPRAAATVHQGGIGTTAEALRAGRPMLVVPWSHDQFDNAARVERHGVGREIRRRDFRVPRVARELGAILSDATTVARAERMGVAIAAERGAERAADALLGRLGAARARAVRG